MSRLRTLLTASFIAIVAAQAPGQAVAQLVVFDPNNYAQNLLTAARALQQINNQIPSLQNEAQMLVNQAKNLASLPYSSLQQLEQSIQRTQQLLSQAQRIAYDVQQIDRAFSTTYAPASANMPDQTLTANAQTRWQNAVAGLQDAMRVQATVVGNLETNRTQMSALVTASQGAAGALVRRRHRRTHAPASETLNGCCQSASGASGTADCRSHRRRRRTRASAKLGGRSKSGGPGPG